MGALLLCFKNVRIVRQYISQPLYVFVMVLFQYVRDPKAF